ncbi:Tox-REase-5 domain-containing protein [Myxococcus eversor]|uniref:Tox-REase-5 domain-containing protein n=1 Tax=Myxococcus eversor TaxID=2709661 RepID=UPI0013D256EB|nr:Tox-REase-5 domain-containing protein [Myxococcus eversor]
MDMKVVLLSVVLLSTGCASLPPPPGGALRSDALSSADSRSHRRRDTRLLASSARSVDSAVVGVDAWERLLAVAGLDERDERPLSGQSLTPTQAARLLARLPDKAVTLGQFPARVAVGFMLREVMASGEASRAELVRRTERFEQVAVLRPDGCLAWVRSGQTQQRVGQVEWKDANFRAGLFELGRFYTGKGGVFRPLGSRLEELRGGAFTDVHDDADTVSRVLDGAEESFVELALAVGQFFSTSPANHLAALQHMPATLSALLASSPEYLEHFQYLPRGEQIQVVSKLVTGLITAWGTASGVAKTMGGTAFATAEVPVLSLSASGALVMERVSVPVGRAAAVLGGGPGAAIILQRAKSAGQSPAPSRGPGQWKPANESMKPAARRYQEQISGHTADDAYWVGDVKFDGYKDEKLLEAKGPNYDNKFTDQFDPEDWFEPTGAQKIIDQAQRQERSVRGLGIPIEWHVAEMKSAKAIEKLLRANGVKDIRVFHTPVR